MINNLLCRDYYTSVAGSPQYVSLIPILQQSPEACSSPEVARSVASFTLAGTLISGILSAIVSPKLGAMSDRYGRKIMIMFTTLGMLAAEIITIVAATYPETFHVSWMYVGFALDGLCGSFIAGMALAHSYATDCTSPARRQVAFSYFHSCLFGGIALGPIIAGLIITATDQILPIFWLALGCHLIFLFCLLFIIPESLSANRQRAAREKYSIELAELTNDRQHNSWLRGTQNAVRDFWQPLTVFYPTGEGSSPALRRNLISLAAIDTILFGIAMGAVYVVIIYLKSEWHWDIPQQSYFIAAVNICRVTGLLVILPIIIRLVRGPASKRKPINEKRTEGCDKLDLGLIRTAIIFDMLGYLGYTLAHTGTIFTVSGCVAAFGGIGGPVLQSAMTKHVPYDRTGALLGASGFLHSLARIVAPVIFNGIYWATVGKFDQAAFLCLTCTFGVAFIVSWLLRPGVYLGEVETPLAGGVAGEEVGEEVGRS